MKYIVEFVIIAIISTGIAGLLPGFMLSSKTIVLRSIFELVITSLGIFILLSFAFFAFKKTKN